MPEIESEVGHSVYLGVIFNELGHGGSRDRKRGWIVIFAPSNLGFDLIDPP